MRTESIKLEGSKSPLATSLSDHLKYFFILHFGVNFFVKNKFYFILPKKEHYNHENESYSYF